MSKTVFPRMEVLQSLHELTADITPNRFITTRPSSTDKSMQEFLLISLNEIRNPADTYQLTRGRITIFVRDVQGGLENTFTLEKLQKDISALFPIRTPLYLATRPVLLPGGSDGAGFHSLIIQFNIRIHKDFDIHPTEIFTL